MLNNLKRTALTFFLVVTAFYLYDISIVKSLFAGFVVSICTRVQIMRRLFENICILAIVIMLLNPNIKNQLASFLSKNF